VNHSFHGGIFILEYERSRREEKDKGADLEFDQVVTPDPDEMLFGDGNGNAGFTTSRANGVEVGLHAKQRFPTPANNFFSNGDGTYSVPKGYACPGYGFAPNCFATPFRSFEWSVNVNFGFTGAVLADYTYELGMDADPSDETDFTIFDNYVIFLRVLDKKRKVVAETYIQILAGDAVATDKVICRSRRSRLCFAGPDIKWPGCSARYRKNRRIFVLTRYRKTCQNLIFVKIQSPPMCGLFLRFPSLHHQSLQNQNAFQCSSTGKCILPGFPRKIETEDG
jgi:hypothetical protein